MTRYVVVVNGKIPKHYAVHGDLHCTAGKNGPRNIYCLDEIQAAFGHGPGVMNGVRDLTPKERAALPNHDCKRCGR